MISVRNTVIVGKWTHRRFQIEKKLGQGGIASVYLGWDLEAKQYFALKLSQDNLALNREYGFLEKFKSLEWVVRAYGIDDWEWQGKTYHFLILEYIHGTDLKTYIHGRRISMPLITGILLMMAKALGQFEQTGYILGDFKPENMMVDEQKRRIRLIDLGGAVKIGEPIKEYTPAYDRASWKCGSRRAEGTYQQFCLVMLAVRLLLRENPDPLRDQLTDLTNKIQRTTASKEIKKFLKLGLEQKIPPEGFVNQIEELYNIERCREGKDRAEKTDLKINLFFAGSLGLMTAVFFFLLKG